MVHGYIQWCLSLYIYSTETQLKGLTSPLSLTLIYVDYQQWPLSNEMENVYCPIPFDRFNLFKFKKNKLADFSEYPSWLVYLYTKLYSFLTKYCRFISIYRIRIPMWKGGIMNEHTWWKQMKQIFSYFHRSKWWNHKIWYPWKSNSFFNKLIHTNINELTVL